MHGKIPQLFDCWADPVTHHLLLKSFMRGPWPRDWATVTHQDAPQLEPLIYPYILLCGSNPTRIPRSDPLLCSNLCFSWNRKKLHLFVGCKPRLAPMKITFEPVPLTAWLISCSMSTLKYIFQRLFNYSNTRVPSVGKQLHSQGKQKGRLEHCVDIVLVSPKNGDN